MLSRKPRLPFTLAALLFALALEPRQVVAGAALEQVRQTAEQVQALVQDPQLKSKPQERRDKIRRALASRFDFTEMAKRSLGSHWQRASAEERKRFVELFTDLLERSYAGQIESYDGEKIAYGRESITGRQAEVDTKIITKKGEQIAINYKLLNQAGEWQVYDVVIENISLVNNYRSQFNRILANASFSELLQKLESKGVDVKPARG
ncbi:MAG TPA: ABC transporter substrate-binding protein [Candidatus Binatia bacterium]|nr:ABC transporter substrate-binding protein [Candidatus Binatia bacterium]